MEIKGTCPYCGKDPKIHNGEMECPDNPDVVETANLFEQLREMSARSSLSRKNKLDRIIVKLNSLTQKEGSNMTILKKKDIGLIKYANNELNNAKNQLNKAKQQEEGWISYLG